MFTEIFPGRAWVPKTLIFAKGLAFRNEIPSRKVQSAEKQDSVVI
jgi:hypothetical protein